jgi:hypothetical protein
MVGFINNDSCANCFTFKVTGCTVSIVQAYAGYVVRPLAEFLNNSANAEVVVSYVAGVSRSCYRVAADAVIAGGARVSAGIGANVAYCARSNFGLSRFKIKSLSL